MKNLNKMLFFCVLGIMISSLPGCLNRTVKEELASPRQKIEDYNGPEKLSPEIANKIIDKIMQGFKNNNYNDFSYRFTSDLRKKLTLKVFKEMHKGISEKIGECQSREFLGELKKGPWNLYLWKGKFSKSKNNDFVIRLTLGELDQAVQVFAFGITPI